MKNPLRTISASILAAGMLCVLLFTPAEPALAAGLWQRLDDGLDIATFAIFTPPSANASMVIADTPAGMPSDRSGGQPPGQTATRASSQVTGLDNPLVILRIDPRHYEFILLAHSEQGHSLSPFQWASRFGLSAVINASMYLPDAKTSTGYMRNGEHVNNDFIHKRFGSFFVASPFPDGRVFFREKELSADEDTGESPPHSDDPILLSEGEMPSATLLDRQTDDWNTLIDRYAVVVQNFRMFNAARLPLWPEDGNAFSIAAVALDAQGNLLFIHCRTPLTVYNLTRMLLDLPLRIEKAMYVEGGPQASLHVQAGNIRRTWTGRYASDFWGGVQAERPLPNVIGARKRK